jgi:hypothetical protein
MFFESNNSCTSFTFFIMILIFWSSQSSKKRKKRNFLKKRELYRLILKKRVKKREKRTAPIPDIYIYRGTWATVDHIFFMTCKSEIYGNIDVKFDPNSDCLFNFQLVLHSTC